MVFQQLTDYGCPNCAALAQWELDCPGYRMKRTFDIAPLEGTVTEDDTVVVCQPVCGNAFLLSCSAKCGWELRVPTNNRASGRGVVPDWLDVFLSEFREGEEL